MTSDIAEVIRVWIPTGRRTSARIRKTLPGAAFECNSMEVVGQRWCYRMNETEHLYFVSQNLWLFRKLFQASTLLDFTVATTSCCNAP
jgi:hypothetical protein